ncbi:hypothetical protein V1477_001194 [Vespula maculifrons]|uniref:Uncharacterized protein n=1 Tax=Vespula maculifrons TaxID=7453 RepID=A0ABD2CZR6_VESMC
MKRNNKGEWPRKDSDFIITPCRTDVERIIIVIGRNPLTRQKISLTSGFCRDDDLSQVVRPQRRQRRRRRTNERKNIRSYVSCLELISRLLDRGGERGGRKIKSKRKRRRRRGGGGGGGGGGGSIGVGTTDRATAVPFMGEKRIHPEPSSSSSLSSSSSSSLSVQAFRSSRRRRTFEIERFAINAEIILRLSSLILSKRKDQITPVHRGATLEVLGRNKREATIDSAIRNILNDS